MKAPTLVSRSQILLGKKGLITSSLWAQEAHLCGP